MKRWPRSRADGPPTGAEDGAAVVDFVLVSLLLVPLVLGLVQVGLVLHVRNTLTAAATEGARYGATVDRTPADGVARTRAQVRGAIADRFARDVSARRTTTDGVPTVEVRVRAVVPPLGLWGPGVALDVEGHGVQEPLVTEPAP
ncbi:TadE-like protein [Nocardioides scoriae]|uniref:TadE-like protein n=1 Tax=Nocardioides scoriae TaxID=642780 RepID=A0A1H1L9C7_9ACTN|nr:TadE/TadG family type IV pilus assembly protein [Nocardioides scoriae]SDR71027.1 TadE-like protein [Nocardioides scoriae]